MEIGRILVVGHKCSDFSEFERPNFVFGLQGLQLKSVCICGSLDTSHQIFNAPLVISDESHFENLHFLRFWLLNPIVDDFLIYLDLLYRLWSRRKVVVLQRRVQINVVLEVLIYLRPFLLNLFFEILPIFDAPRSNYRTFHLP